MNCNTVTRRTSELNVNAPNTRNSTPTVVKTVEATHAPTSSKRPTHPERVFVPSSLSMRSRIA
jgi:hypothetical protein